MLRAACRRECERTLEIQIEGWLNSITLVEDHAEAVHGIPKLLNRPTNQEGQLVHMPIVPYIATSETASTSWRPDAPGEASPRA